MKFALKSKHQRLILQCYPPGKNVDKKPNPSELSYLLYYATTRRTKLLKVGVFLQKKVISDYNHNRSGNLKVALDIINGLIDKCSENIDAFAVNLLVIFKHILMTKDLALCQYLLPIFSRFCEEIKSDVFNGDADFIDNFEDVCQSFVRFGYHPIAPNVNEWIILGLRSIQGFSPTLAYNNGLTEVLVNNTMPLILNSIYEIDKSDLDAHLAPEATNELKRLATIKNVPTATSNSQDPPALGSDTIEGEAYRSLSSFFDTTSNSTGNQLQNSSKALIEYMIAKNAKPSWANRLIQLCVSWIPVSSRFKFLDSLFKELIRAKDRKTKLTLTGQVSGLLSSRVTLISLDVPGTLKILCREQLALVTDDPACVNDELILSYANCIRSLTSHLYYRNQVSDIISGLLKECCGYLERYSMEGEYKNSVMVLNNDIRSLLKKHYNESNESLSLDIWEDTFSFLLVDDATLVDLYVNLLLDFLSLEVRNPEAFQKPNYNKYITNQLNPLSQFFQYIHDYFNLNSVVEPGALNSLTPVLLKLIERYGVNTIANGLPYFFRWQLKDLSNVKGTETAQDTFAFIFLYESAKFLRLDQFQDQVLGKVKFRETHDLLFKTNYGFDTGAVKENSDPFVTAQSVQAQLTDDTETLTWLNTNGRLENREDYNGFLSSSLSKQSSFVAINDNMNNNHINHSNDNNNNNILTGDNTITEHDRTVNSSNSTPSITTPTTTNLNGLENNYESIQSTFQTRSFTPTSSFVPKASPRVIDLKHAISGNGLRVASFGNGSIRSGQVGGGVGFASSVVSSRILDDVGSLLAELDVDGNLSSDEENSYTKGRLVR